MYYKFVEVHAVRVVGDVRHDLLEDGMLTVSVLAEGAGVGYVGSA